MRAVVCTRYGAPEVLQLADLPKPTPTSNEVRIKIFATAVTASDCIVRAFIVPRRLKLVMGAVLGFTKPRNPILGLVLAGEVESVGRDVAQFKPGNQVYAFTAFRFGAYAEYKCLPEKAILALKPSNVTYEEAAAVPYGGLLALYFLKKANIQGRQHVLVYGASGAIGTSAVQLAKYFGAEVTGVCSTPNLNLVKSLGADAVIDYTKEDFTKPATYDLIFHTVGKISFSACMKSLKKGGVYASALLLGAVLRKPWALVSGRKRVVGGIAKPKAEDLVFLKDLIEAGELRAVIDRRYPLEQIAEAHRYVEGGHKKGNVVITLG